MWTSTADRAAAGREKETMKIGIIGSGNIGQALGRLWAKKGHKIYYSFSHDKSNLENLARESGNDSQPSTPYDAVRCAEIVLFSPPWTEVDEAIKQVGRFEGQVVIDTTNPFVNDQMNVQEFDEGDSSSQCIQRKLGDAKVIKAFNTLKAQTLQSKSGTGLVVFVAGDDAVAKATVCELVEDAGFAPYDAGTLVEGKNQEPGTDRFLKELTREQVDAPRATTGEIDLDQPIRKYS
ncbi:MAG: NADPH-dependent F420 reductase [Candidatus Baltobacteraceae bacterium]